MATVAINLATGSLQQEEIIVGIDLGTTNSLVAIWRDGEAAIIPNALGEHLTPSCVSIDDDGTNCRVAQQDGALTQCLILVHHRDQRDRHDRGVLRDDCTRHRPNT